MSRDGCDFDHPHPDHPCGRRVVMGVTTCSFCGNLDGSPECVAAGCWEDVSEADVDALYAEAWGIADPGANVPILRTDSPVDPIELKSKWNGLGSPETPQ